MAIWEVMLIGVALSMDAFAVGMTDGMTEPKMRVWKILFIALLFGLFQFLMPVLGYYFGSIFTSLVEGIAPWLSFAILAFLGGKMVFDFFLERKRRAAENSGDDGDAEKPEKANKTPKTAKADGLAGVGRLFVQAVATSVDALAVGVTFLAAETEGGLPLHVVLCALIIGGITFCLTTAAVFLGKRAGDKFSDKAELVGGLILIAIGLKILIEGLI